MVRSASLFSNFWDVEKQELTRLTPIFAIFFLLSFIYNFLRPFKISDVTEATGGAEVIPFLKLWGVLPGAVLLTALVIFLSNHVRREYVLYWVLSLFVSFFLIFTHILTPNLEHLVLHNFAHTLSLYLPKGLAGLIAVIKYWPISLFYVFSELWGAILIYTVFWGFVNETTSLKDAKRFYAFFSLSSNFSLILAGYLGSYVANLPFLQINLLGATQWEQSLNILSYAVLTVGILCALIFRHIHSRAIQDQANIDNLNLINSHVTPNIEQNNKHAAKSEQAEKPKLIADTSNSKLREDLLKGQLSLWQSIKYVFSSGYLTKLLLIIVSYNIAANLSETLWVSEAGKLYPIKSERTAYIADITMYIGLLASFIDLFITGTLIRKAGWKITAMLAPIVFFLTGLAFYGLLLSRDGMLAWLAIPSTNIIMHIASIHLCSARATKLTVMDATKELAYVPLSKEEKRKAKAIIDGIGSRSSKSAGSVIYQLLFLQFLTISASAAYIVALIIILNLTWLYCVHSLGKDMDNTEEDNA